MSKPSLEIDELISSGDHVVQIGHTSGRVLRTGKRFRAREVHIDVPHMLDALA